MSTSKLIEKYLKETTAESRPYQLRVIEKAYNLFDEGKARSVLIESPTGCITGDALVTFYSNCQARTLTLADAYYYYGEKKPPDLRVAGYDELDLNGLFKYNDVDSVVQSGVKTVFRLTLLNGFTLKATADHKIWTNVGWVELINITDEHLVLVENTTPAGQWTVLKSIEKLGEEMTYDICCAAPNHNFVANGIVVHNSGKSVMALSTAGLMHKHHGARIGWVAMRRPLLKQAHEENMSKGFNIPIQYISMFEKNVPTDIDMLVIDEAHHDVTNSMAHIHSTIKPKWMLGNSATVQRSDRVKLCFDAVIKDAGIATLIQDGYLSPYYHYTIPDWSVDAVVEFYLKEPDRWGKSLIYFHKVQQCMEAADKFLQAGVPVEVVTGDSDVDTQLSNFRQDKTRILINCMKLVEGVDLPDVKTVFCRPSCKPLTIQMAGRVLRRHKDHAYKQIVQCKNAPYQFQKTAFAKVQHIWQDDMWKTLEVNENISHIMRQTTIALAQTKNVLPKFLSKAKQPMPGRVRRFRESLGLAQNVANIPLAPQTPD